MTERECFTKQAVQPEGSQCMDLTCCGSPLCVCMCVCVGVCVCVCVWVDCVGVVCVRQEFEQLAGCKVGYKQQMFSF